MNLIGVYKAIKELELSIFRTSDIAITLSISNQYACKLLRQLSNERLLLHLRRDLWVLKESVDLLMLPDYLTAPMPSYISLQSALYHHGLISQIPSVIYAISIARTKVYSTPIADYSIHHIKPNLFCGFERIGPNEILMAQPEKALFDFFYLKSTKSLLFYALPEIEIPEKFNWRKLKDYVKKVENKSRQVMILNSLNDLASVSKKFV